MLRTIRNMPDGLVKTELLKSCKNIEKMLDGEMEASKCAWKIEPLLERIETSGVKVRKGADSLVLLVHCVLEESGLIPVHKPTSSSSSSSSSNSDLIIASDWNMSKDGLYILKYVVHFSIRIEIVFSRVLFIIAVKLNTNCYRYRMINPSHEEIVPDDMVILKVLQIGSTLSLNLIHEKTGT